MDGLTENKNANGLYQAYGGAGGQTAPRAVSNLLQDAYKFGISLDKDLVENELATGEPGYMSIESVLVHEVQHATSHDHGTELRAKENATGDALVALPYEDIADAAIAMKPVYDENPTAESRADLAMVLYLEVEQRGKLGGPKLNEMPDDERRAAMSGILMRYVENHHDRDRNEAELLGALKDPRYIRDQGSDATLPNPVWEPDTDASRTVRWAHGHDVSGHRPRDSSLIEQLDSLGTNLPGMAERWTSGDSHRPGTGNQAEMSMPLDELGEQVAAKLKRIDEQVARADGPPHPQTETGYAGDGPNPGNPPTAEARRGAPAEGNTHEERPDTPVNTGRPGGQPDGGTTPNVQHDHDGTAYQGYTIERRDDPDPRETGLLAENDYQEEIGRELDAILDSMLITSRVPPGTPFEDRVGAIPNERIRALMEDVDESLGGRIEWPNIHISDELSTPTALAQYRAHLDAHGATIPESVNRGEPADEKFGITIRRDVYESGLDGQEPMGLSLRSVLVHELQHATSSDNVSTLTRIADENGWPYPDDAHAMSEGRADLAVLLEREVDARSGAGGPKLNEMDPGERREAISQILGGYLGAEPGEPEHVRDAKLLLALRDPAYLASPDNLMWQRNGDDQTNDYVYGRDQSGSFVPNHSTPEERRRDLEKPLTELASEWRNATTTTGENRPGTANREAPQTEPKPTDRQAPDRNAAAPATPTDRQAPDRDRSPNPPGTGTYRNQDASAPTTAASEKPDQKRDAETRQERQPAGQAHLKLLLHARQNRASQTAEPREQRTGRSSAAAGEQEFAPPSGRYSTGRSHRGETTAVRGSERTAGGTAPAARQKPTAERASTR